MDKVRLLAEQRHFHTAEVDLADYGRILMIGDKTAVEHVLRLIAEHGEAAREPKDDA